MGVKDLWPILLPGETALPLSALKGKTLAVDLSGWVVESYGTRGLAAAVKKPHLRNLVFRTLCLCQLGVKLVFVMDGAATELKWEVMERRERGRGRGEGCSRGRVRKTGVRPVLNMNLREVSVWGDPLRVCSVWCGVTLCMCGVTLCMCGVTLCMCALYGVGRPFACVLRMVWGDPLHVCSV